MNSEEIYEYAREIKADINRETSAKENQGINDLFVEISTKLYKKHKLKVSMNCTNTIINLLRPKYHYSLI